MVKVNNRNLRNKRTMCLKLTIKAAFNLEQILHSNFTIRFYTLYSNFYIADFEQLDSCWFLKS